jgi:transposase
MTEALSNKEIAARICLSENTVKTHIQEIDPATTGSAEPRAGGSAGHT